MWKNFIKLSLLVISSFLLSACQKQIKNIVYVYQDEGVAPESFAQTIAALNDMISTQYIVAKINAAEIIDNQWHKNAALFVMPGGADVPYIKKLNGAGNDKIKLYVKNGGSYLGICAGSYYASAYVEFGKNGSLEVLGSRELAFFPDKAIGPILAKYDYKKNSGARTAKIAVNLNPARRIAFYYNGGGYFLNATHYPNVRIIGSYQNTLPAIIYINYVKGNVILSAVHFEYNPFLLDHEDPFLYQIIPKLKHDNIARIKFMKEMLNMLGLDTKN